VPVEEAVLMGLHDPDATAVPHRSDPAAADADEMVEISCWRHAMVNIPHPLLEMGLVIVDTPGLNAIGAEPELTLNLIPSAHAVLFLLAADTGVTRTDVEVWREHINPVHRAGRFVVLNKIDGLWDDLRLPAEIDREILGQVESVGRLLQLPADRIYPVSAQKGLVAKIHRDDALLARSRLPALEHALSHEMVPRQQTIVRDQVRREFDDA
jgi:GTPase Era involved in 16S rRNA processing